VVSLLQVEKAEAARTFRDLGEFITEIREACSVLMTEADYYEVTRAYLRRAAAQNVRYAELQVAPQEHTTRGVPIATLLSGMHRAMAECAASVDGAAGPISSRLIIDLVKDAPVDDSVACLKEVLRHRDLAGVCAAAVCSSLLDSAVGAAAIGRRPDVRVIACRLRLDTSMEVGPHRRQKSATIFQLPA
jgi:adenosine deaminase